MAVTAFSEFGVLGLALFVDQAGDTRPVVKGVGKPWIAGIPSEDDLALARAARHRSLAAQVAQSMVISLPQGFGGFCKQRGEVDPADAWQGVEDRRVALLPRLPRLSFSFAGLGWRGQQGAQPVELPMGLLAMPRMPAVPLTRV